MALESLKEFWDAMDEIDGKTWVLEPENPTRSATTRRIAIGMKRFGNQNSGCCFAGKYCVFTNYQQNIGNIGVQPKGEKMGLQEAGGKDKEIKEEIRDLWC